MRGWRLRGRLRDGDPDMAPDELQAAIDRVVVKRRQLLAGLHDGADIARILSTVPKAVELYEERIALGLQGDQAACEEARIILRLLIPDRICLSKKDDGSLWAHCAVQPAALLATTGSRGRGDRI